MRLLYVDSRPDLLQGLLDLGVGVNELKHRDGHYRVRGRRARALATAEGDHLAAMVDEMLTYHASVYLQLTARMRGAPPGDYLDEHATVIARSSRMLEPFLARFVDTVVRGRGPLRLLEIGCGSGVHVRHAADGNADVTGVAIDIQPQVAERARQNLADWGLADRFTVVHGDIRRPPPEVAGSFDLVTMHQNVYYFQEDERVALFERIRAWLQPGGRYVLTSFMRGKTLASLDFDIALRCTAGCTGLPEVGALTAQLKQAGFAKIEPTRLMPLESLYGIIAS